MSRRIGRYEIQGLIGQGGFGQVFRAFDPTVGRLVAIKTITAAGDTDLIQRFRNEAAAAGRLRHQNIIIIYDFGEDDGQPFLVMELLDGEDLERVIKSGNHLSLLEKLDVISQAAAGLHQAHAMGILHRDVKPANIMLQRDGVVKIMDFGIALLSQATAARLTATGEIPGTVSYMAPEQLVGGGGSDTLTDIWGFGVTCYKLLTGVHPFQAEALGSTVYKIVNSHPEPIRALAPECPEALEQAVMRLMSKDRDARYQSLEEVRFDLEPVIADLRRERVHELLASARAMIAENRLDGVPRVLRTVLESDPANRTARELRDELQRKIRENEVRPKIAVLLQEGLHEMQTRRFDEAAKKFESVLRLDHSNTQVRGYLANVQAARERVAQANQLVQRAESALSGDDLTGARKSIADALATDPENAAAARLEHEVAERIERRERERRLDEELNQARRLMFLESFAEAVEKLERVAAAYPESPVAKDLLARARAQQEIREKRLRLQQATDEAKNRIKAGRFIEALDWLKTARADFPEATELRDLETFAAEEHAAQRQAEAVTNAIAEAQALAQTVRFDAALTLLRTAFAEYPGAAPLRDALQAIGAAKSEHDRVTAMRDAESQVRTLLEKGRLVEATARIEVVTRAYGHSPELESLRKNAERALEARRRQAAAGTVVANAQSLLDEGKAENATQLLRDATVQFPGEANLVQLLAEAEQKLEQQRAADAISKIISEAESLSRSRQFVRALQVLEGGLRQYPNTERLERCRQATLAIQARRQNEERAQKALEEAETLRRQGKPDEALAEIDAALLDGGEYPKLRRLRAEIEKDQAGRRVAARQVNERQQAIEALKDRVKRLRQAGQITAALEAIAADPDLASADPEIAAMRPELEALQTASRREESFRQLTGRAEELLRADRATEVVALIEGTKEFADRPSATELLGRARGRIAEQERERALTAAQAVIRRLADAGQYDQALHAIDVALKRYPGSDQLADLRRSIAGAQERAECIERAAAEATSLVHTGRSRDALALLGDVETRYPGEARIAAVKREAELSAAEAEAEALLAQRKPDEAIALIGERFPDERRFDAVLTRAREQSDARRQREATEQARRRLLELEQAVTSTARRKLTTLANEARRISAIHGDRGELDAIASRIEEQVRAALAVAPVRREFPVRWIATAAIAFAVALGAMLLPRAFHTPAPKPVTAALFALEVRTDPESTPVRVAGQRCDRPVCRFDLPAGTYIVHAERPGYRAADRTVKVGQEAQNGLITLSLEPQAPPPPPKGAETGVLAVATAPGARVLVDNTPEGLANAGGELSATVQAGSHEVRVEKAGYVAAPGLPVVITEGRTQHVRIELTPKMGELAIRGAPAGVKIRLDKGKEAVTAASRPFRLSAAGGEGTLHVADANGARDTLVRIEPGATSTLDWAAIAPQKKLVPTTVTTTLSTTASTSVPVAPVPQSSQPALTSGPTPTPGPTQEQRESQDWEKARKSADPAQVDAFLRDHPDTRFAAEARSLLDELAWSRTRPGNAQSLQDYAARFPHGAHLADAQTQLQRLTTPPPAASLPTPLPSAPSIDTSGLREAIQRFNNAFLRKSAKDLRQAWPAAPDAWQNIFQQKGAMSIATLYPQGQPEMKGDEASWRCELMVQNIVRGQPQSPERKIVTVILRRAGGGWVIQSL